MLAAMPVGIGSSQEFIYSNLLFFGVATDERGGFFAQHIYF